MTALLAQVNQVSDVNVAQRGVDWQMRIDDARTKLKSVYPTIKL